jgi:FAD/FMN-containing dehydrogenase
MSRSCRKAGWLFAEFGADTAGNSLERLVADLKASGHAAELLRDPAEQAKLWRVRRDGLPATAKLPEWPETYEGWEDSAVPHEKLGSYLREFKLLLHALGYGSSVYGHFGDGLVHCRIDFDLRTEEGIQNWQSFLEGAAGLVVRYGGSLSDEHGDGQSKAALADAAAWALQKKLLNYLETLRDLPDRSIWEFRSPGRHFTYSKVMAWVAFDRAVAAVAHFGLCMAPRASAPRAARASTLESA